MSCRDGERCVEGRNRLRALLVLGAMLIVFIVLSAFSFLDSRGQVTPHQFHFNGHSANAGKRVFQAYNCMDCHTMLGNGAYFAPDLTDEYRKAGPAWLAAFLPSAGHWPTEAALKVQLADPRIAAAAGTSSIEDYYRKFPGARPRVTRRDGKTLMPNLPLSHQDIEKLIAYFQYTSAMDTEGWPPKVETGSLAHRLQLAHLARTPSPGSQAPTPPAASPGPSGNAATTPDPAGKGRQLATTFGCTGCHSTGDNKLVGPGWGGLYGSTVQLADGSTVTADDAYLTQSILDPDAKVVTGYPKGVMPNYSSLLTQTDVSALVAYIHSLEKSK